MKAFFLVTIGKILGVVLAESRGKALEKAAKKLGPARIIKSWSGPSGEWGTHLQLLDSVTTEVTENVWASEVDLLIQ